MKRNKQWILLVFMGLLLASCPTAPKADMIGRADVDAAKMAADQARMQSDAVMAEKAASTGYMEAEDHYGQAEKADKAENLEVAHDGYNMAAEAFRKSADAAESARMAALEVIRKSDELITEIEAAANEALDTAAREAP